MRFKTRIANSVLGFVAELAGVEHGIFEILGRPTKPEGIVIESMDPPCVLEEIWNACEPAMTILPNFLLTGFPVVIPGLLAMIWSAGFIEKNIVDWF